MQVVGIEHDGDVLTPKDETAIQTNDVISLLWKAPIQEDALEVFRKQ